MNIEEIKKHHERIKVMFDMTCEAVDKIIAKHNLSDNDESFVNDPNRATADAMFKEIAKESVKLRKALYNE